MLCIFPTCYAVNDTRYVLYNIFSRLLTLSVARVFYHNSVLGAEINPNTPRKQSKVDPEGNGPVQHND